MKKIIRSLCYFTQNPDIEIVDRINTLKSVLENNNFVVQTTRLCGNVSIKEIDEKLGNTDLYLSVGVLIEEEIKEQFVDFIMAKNVAFNLELSGGVTESDVELLFRIIKEKPTKTFNFAYVFNNVNSSPYFPSANYERDGFVVGLQSTDLAEDCNNLGKWLELKKNIWKEIVELFKNEDDFLGIDSSVAPLFTRSSSFINLVKRFKGDFSDSIVSDFYLKITEFIKKENPKPIGLCGLMLPCLEDFELAEEYEQGNFSVERNLFLSLHSGLGIDTYPIGTDEDKDRVLEILNVVRGLSNKYHKPLSVRFISDGKARIGEMTDFQNQFLKDVIVKKL